MSDLNSSASCAGSLEDACSVASDVSIYGGGYLGVMAKFGPFCRRDSCSLVRGVFGKIDNPLVRMVSTCMGVDGVAAGWKPLCCMGGHCAGGRCGAHECGRNTGSGESCRRSK